MNWQKMTRKGTQLSFFKEQVKCCDLCEHYSPLKIPRKRTDGAVIFGYCFADGTESYNYNEGKGFAVFVPDGGCNRFKRNTKQELAEGVEQ